jgi:predicted nucleic acid-binding Zn ribbon protein
VAQDQDEGEDVSTPKYVYVYTCEDCGHRDAFLTELQEDTVVRCSLCRGVLIGLVRREV